MTVYLVGAGPGDPGLITVRGLELVRRAEVLVFDRLIGDELLDEAPAGCVLIDASKRPDHHTMTQDEIDACLVEHGTAGRLVVRLKGGDPFVFGRGGEEALALSGAGVPFEVVPGITSAIAAPAYAGIPVTHRNVSAQLAIVTGHERPGKETSEIDWDVLARFRGTLVFLMGVGRLGEIAGALIEQGKDPATPAAVVQSGTLPAQHTVTGPLSQIAAIAHEAGIRAPAVTVVGDVAGLRDGIAWAETRPLHGRTIAVTRARAQSSVLVARLRELGARVVEAPTIRTETIEGPQLRGADYDLVCVTSPNAPRLLLDRLGGDARSLAGVRVAAIGPGTSAALRACGIVADLVSDRFVGEGLVDSLGDVTDTRVLVARAEEARDVLPDGLRAAGATVSVVPLYRTLREAPRDIAAVLAADVVAFSAASTVRNLAAALAGSDAGAVRAVSIGPVTSEAIRAHGFELVAEAAQHDLDGLVETIVERFGNRQPT
ncbi:MAG TPA: uroporphyrinogen-III C-methyltransferase [Gaiellales bacterium]